MSITNLFIRSPKYIGSVQADAIISESHSSEIEVTSFPVEFGADITDHAILKPSEVVVRGTITDTPLVSLFSTELIDSITRIFGASTVGGDTRSQQGYAALVALQQARELISIQTRLVNYSNMLITSIKTTQDKNTSRVVDFTLTAKEVIIVNTLISQVDASQLETGKTTQQASSTVESGRKVVTDVSSNTSWLKKVGGLFQ